MPMTIVYLSWITSLVLIGGALLTTYVTRVLYLRWFFPLRSKTIKETIEDIKGITKMFWQSRLSMTFILAGLTFLFTGIFSNTPENRSLVNPVALILVTYSGGGLIVLGAMLFLKGLKEN
ncbi:MAG: hypothetical protein UU71_C0004G0018 [Parcubacteria group bacterium GW2011_GWB1_41_6]|nr:MAG: hypothetical protein UU71_C0004G0018 [Parcubacteria group bacterium GW2011_GWB1_41_6]KKS33939.1 MAG: hypothetical protein UU96_C0011G0017 [Parcubacteria group bacterium GW2011_GWC2_42_13]